jgi:16S rRNA (adenine1518-N6/adenine1519-N6)-dimethyltransferase
MNKRQNFPNIKNFVPSKKMGQNFLTDRNVAQNIINLIDVDAYDLIIEVGPGMGALTEYLVEFNHKVMAVELDKRLAAKLTNKFKQYDNLEIMNHDILQVDLEKISSSYKKVVLVSNLPYSISTPMMLKFLKQNKIQTFYCMLQKELVDRLIARPNSKEYGGISVLMQTYADIANLLDVSPNSFTPPPKVESNVIVINRNDKTFNDN